MKALDCRRNRLESRDSNSGFTLIELVAAIAVMVIVLGALLPAVQKVREAANRAETGTFLTALTAIMQDFHRTNGQFPDSWITILELAKAPPDGAVNGFQLIPVKLAAHELSIHAEPMAGVTGSEKWLLRIKPTADGSALDSSPIAGADDARTRMFIRLFNFTMGEIAALSYLLPDGQRDELSTMIIPFLEQSPTSPEVMSGLANLSLEGVFSLTSFFEKGPAGAVDDPALQKRFAAFVQQTRAILQIGTYNEPLSRDGVVVKQTVPSGDTVAHLVYNFGALAELTRGSLSGDRARKAGLSADQTERELLLLLEQADRAGRKGDDERAARLMAQYIERVLKVEGVLLTRLQVDALVGMARALGGV